MTSLAGRQAAQLGLRGADDFAERIDAIRVRAQQKAERAPLPGAPFPAEVARLPLWPQAVRAVPNGFLRSALFGAIAKGKRRYLQGELVASVDGIEIRYSGQRLDQGDLDVWVCLLHAVRLQELGSRCRLTAYAMLKLVGKTDTGKNRAILHARIERLRANAVTIKNGRHTYIGGLIDGAFKDEKTQEWVVMLNPGLRSLFAQDQFTQIEWAVRHALDGKPLAQWLHGFYSSHAKPYPMRMATLLKLAGSEDSNPRSAQQTLRKALDAVAEAGAPLGEKFRYEIHGDLVYVEKEGSAAQQRHLKKRKVPRKPRA
jgi:hypothetical protein